tara:strand:- start:3059 stop:3166 length:108 start_codon:yes stop_codon:yes gene_type:complete
MWCWPFEQRPIIIIIIPFVGSVFGKFVKNALLMNT